MVVLVLDPPVTVSARALCWAVLQQQLWCLTVRVVAAPAFGWSIPSVAHNSKWNGNPKMNCGISGKNPVGFVLTEVHNSKAFSQLFLSFILLGYQQKVLPPDCGVGAGEGGQCEQFCSLSWHLRQKESWECLSEVTWPVALSWYFLCVYRAEWFPKELSEHGSKWGKSLWNSCCSKWNLGTTFALQFWAKKHFPKYFLCIYPRAELSISAIVNIICVGNMENNQTKLQMVMNSALMEACLFGCFLREMSLFVHFNGKIILLHIKKKYFYYLWAMRRDTESILLFIDYLNTAFLLF